MPLSIVTGSDNLAIFLNSGSGKKFALTELPVQKRAGKGVIVVKPQMENDYIASAVLAEDGDNILITGSTKSVCISMAEVPLFASRTGSVGNQMIKGNITSVSKV